MTAEISHAPDRTDQRLCKRLRPERPTQIGRARRRIGNGPIQRQFHRPARIRAFGSARAGRAME
ncbi:MAG: hypothetical protein RJB09_1418, partial [Pseudomonadota bacterium]